MGTTSTASLLEQLVELYGMNTKAVLQQNIPPPTSVGTAYGMNQQQAYQSQLGTTTTYPYNSTYPYQVYSNGFTVSSEKPVQVQLDSKWERMADIVCEFNNNKELMNA